MREATSRESLMVRFATLGEVPTIQRVGLAADARYASGPHPEMADGTTIPPDVAARAIAQNRLLVAEIDGDVVGWVYVGRVDGELCVGQVSVVPDAGRRGVGSALLARVIADARAAGERSIVLNTQRDLPWGMPWYARLGFAVIPREDWSSALTSIAAAQTDDGLDWSTRVHMRLHLDRAP